MKKYNVVDKKNILPVTIHFLKNCFQENNLEETELAVIDYEKFEFPVLDALSSYSGFIDLDFFKNTLIGCLSVGRDTPYQRKLFCNLEAFKKHINHNIKCLEDYLVENLLLPSGSKLEIHFNTQNNYSENSFSSKNDQELLSLYMRLYIKYTPSQDEYVKDLDAFNILGYSKHTPNKTNQVDYIILHRKKSVFIRDFFEEKFPKNVSEEGYFRVDTIVYELFLYIVYYSLCNGKVSKERLLADIKEYFTLEGIPSV